MKLKLLTYTYAGQEDDRRPVVCQSACELYAALLGHPRLAKLWLVWQTSWLGPKLHLMARKDHGVCPTFATFDERDLADPERLWAVVSKAWSLAEEEHERRSGEDRPGR